MFRVFVIATQGRLTAREDLLEEVVIVIIISVINIVNILVIDIVIIIIFLSSCIIILTRFWKRR